MERGTECVAVNVSHAATRNKFTTVLAMCSMDDVPHAPPAIIFKIPTGGTQVAKQLKKDIQAGKIPDVPFFVTPSGNTIGDVMPDPHLLQEQHRPPLRRTWATHDASGWRVSMFDSYEAHKSWLRENYRMLLGKKIFTLLIPGGLTGDVQPCDLVLNKVCASHFFGATTCITRHSRQLHADCSNNGNWLNSKQGQ